MNIDNQIVYKMIEDICPFYKDGMCYANLPLKPFECRHNCGYAIIGTVVYRKGYRRTSEVAREIFEEIEEGIKAAVSALQFENNPIHRKVRHEVYSSVMRFVKSVEERFTEESK